MWSATARDLLRARHGVDVGAYSYGACLRPGALPAGVEVGRYVSMATQVAVFRRDHPLERLSMHPFFFNADAGPLAADDVDPRPLWIGHDAWIGHGAVVTAGCGHIGVGAVVAAGAVVTADVGDLEVVGGNPARPLRRRFDDDTCAAVLDSRWWELPAAAVFEHLDAMGRPLAESLHPLVHRPAAAA